MATTKKKTKKTIKKEKLEHKKTDEPKKIVVGPSEKIIIKSKTKQQRFECRIDTGAASSSIHSEIVADMNLGPVIMVKKIRNSHGETLRPVIEANISLKGKKMKAIFTVTDRSKMKYPVLIGRNVLKQGFLIDLNE